MVLRYLISLVLASVVTFGLFLMMHVLVATGDTTLKKSEVFDLSNMISIEEDTLVERKSREIERPPEPETPPPDIEVPKTATLKPQLGGINMQVARVEANVDLGGVMTGTSDGEYLPLVVYPPQYPRRAQERGVEGYVIVSFTVTAMGTTEGCMAIEADPKNYFERAACKAASKYKYKPKVVNGEPMPVSGVMYKVVFNLAD